MTDVQRREFAALAATLAEKRAFYESGQTEFAIGYEDAAWDGKPEVAIQFLLEEVERLRARSFALIARLDSVSAQIKGRLQEELAELAKSYPKRSP